MTPPLLSAAGSDQRLQPIDPGQLRPYLNTLRLMLLAFDADGTCVLSEGGLLANFGNEPGERVGDSLADYFAEYPEGVNAAQRALAGETLFTRIVSGGPVSVDVQWCPQRDETGKVAGVIVCATENGEDTDADAVERAEQAYRALLSAIPDQLFRLDHDGKAVVIKPANDPDALQLPLSWSPTPLTDAVHASVATTLFTAAAEVQASETEQIVETLVDADGHQRYLETRLIPEGPRVIGLVREMTERRQAEEERREASKLEALGRLSAGVAHEINTPIQFVSHNVEFMRDSFAAMHELLLAYREALHSPQSLPWAERSAKLQEAEQQHDAEFLLSEVPQAVEDTLDGIRRVGTIVNALKQFSHPSPHEMAASDVNEALRSAIVVSVNEHKMVADIDEHLGDLPPVVCDPGELTQVFLNLIVNAAHAVESLIVERGDRGRIEISSEQAGDHVVVRISDDGPGISYEDQSRIFDAFFTTKVVGKGTGQGLTLARSIVADRHGGELRLHSVPGEGATFEVRLPVAGPPVVPTDVEAAIAAGGTA